MIVFLYTEYGKLFKNIPDFINTLEWTSTSFDLFYHSTLASFFIIDVSLGLIGYLCSSRWLRNKSKSVDSSLSGWMVALVCYPPFNSITHNYLPYSQSSGSPYAILQYEWIAILLKVIILLLFAIYVWATMAFGLRFSNLTNRGILTKGPYAWVRHPAYFCKNLAWWGESIRSFSSPGQFLFLAVWNVIYFLRAYTEERHLRQDPDYLAYCERVKYKFIPGVW
jgi:protein-S-isoprenylcysteine O-methyltransferase Ste14